MEISSPERKPAGLCLPSGFLASLAIEMHIQVAGNTWMVDGWWWMVEEASPGRMLEELAGGMTLGTTSEASPLC